MARQSYPSVPETSPPLPSDRDGLLAWASSIVRFIQQITDVTRTLRDGKINSVGDITLDASAATTTLTDRLITADSFIGFMPTTANAAAALQDGAFYISARDKGTATITHTNDANADKTLTYVILG